MTQEEAEDENPQNPLSRRLYLVHPKEELIAKLGMTTEHPATEVTAILTPQLRYETWFEGWSHSWRAKAKGDFLASFIDLWSSPYAPAKVSPDFLASLRASENPERTFDEWWTIQERINLIEIDPKWRPS